MVKINQKFIREVAEILGDALGMAEDDETKTTVLFIEGLLSSLIARTNGSDYKEFLGDFIPMVRAEAALYEYESKK